MKLPCLKIGDITAKLPIIQGGMGIGVSLSSLASSVANEGGIGIISAAQIGFNQPDFEVNCIEANIRALREEIRRAKSLSPSGIIGINILTAASSYKEMILTAVEENIDIIIAGAGIPLDLPELCKDSNVKIIPIVSSKKAVSLITRAWMSRYSRLPDAVIVEGPEAGGHLGFIHDEINHLHDIKLENIVLEVIDALKPYVEKYNKDIPVIAAGGIYTGSDIARFLKLGASGVQMATRFVATNECDASLEFKLAYVNSNQEDITIIKSPVGMPGRAIKNAFVKTVENNRLKITKCYNCLKKCSPNNTPYCITEALIRAVKGDVENGLIFTGSSSYRIDRIVPVKELINELVSDAEACY